MPLAAQAPSAPAAESGAQTFDMQQLDALVAPVALYPDELPTQVLMAATFPLQVVEAGRWLDDPAHKALKGDALAKALEPLSWDPSVKSLVQFPQVIAQMNGNLEWMQQLGYAFTEQQQDVFNSVQRLRSQAQANGKLQSSQLQVVSTQAGPSGQTTIVIQPAQTNTMYVPTYNPSEVYGAWPYPAYPPVYLPPPPGYLVGTAIVTGLAFGAGVAIAGGPWGWARPNWGAGNVNVNVNRWNNINVNRQHINSNVWKAGNRPGRQNRGNFTPANRPNLSPGSRPSGGIAQGGVNCPGNPAAWVEVAPPHARTSNGHKAGVVSSGHRVAVAARLVAWAMVSERGSSANAAAKAASSVVAPVVVAAVDSVAVEETWDLTRQTTSPLLRACLRKVVSARVCVIQARDVDPREPWPDGRDCPQDEAISV